MTINTIDKEENQTIVDDIENNEYKIYKQYNAKAAIKHSGNLIDAIKIILEVNKILTSGKVNNNNDSIKTYEI